MPSKKKKHIRWKKKVSKLKSLSKRKCVHENPIANSRGDVIIAPRFVRQRPIGKFDQEGVQRIMSPFNRFANNSTKVPNKTIRKSMTDLNVPPLGGLSPKEKSYVICSCQNKTSRYLKLKTIAATAIKENKIFAIYGSCSAVRKALIDRGWVEKIPTNRMSLNKIRNGNFSNKSTVYSELERLLLSNFVEKCSPNFIWRSKDEHTTNTPTIDMNKEINTVVNKLKVDALWTSKQGLCFTIKNNYWFYIEDVAEVNSPRSYNTYDNGEVEEFTNDFRLTACTSLLKWILSMVSNDRPIFAQSGNISINVIVFALNRCKEYLFRKQNKDIDKSIVEISNRQWDAFLKKYYRIIAKDEVFQAEKGNKLPLYLGYAKFLLKEIHRYRPQLSCEGCHNIWIIKPGNCSRGRGIRMASKLAVITNLLNKTNAKYVIQKYIEEPLLIHDTKFDIRQYYLVTSTYPLVIWMYEECYLKFSSQKYNLKNYHESIHLTNNAVQRKYKNCQGRHAELPNNNMWDSERYKRYLHKIGKEQVWEHIIYPGMKRSIISVMLSCQDSLSVSRNRFELYGCDFILDKEYKPWLIEINSCPDLNNTTQVTAHICPAVVSDIIKVVIDHSTNPQASTGKFECIFRQPMTLPRYGASTDLVVRGYSLPLEYFYRGSVEIKESYDDPDIGRTHDVKATLNKLKQIYNTDIMMEPDEDYESSDQACSHNTESEFELSIAAEITNHPDRITPYTRSYKTLRDTSPSIRTIPKKGTDIKTFFKKSLNRFASLEAIHVKKLFHLSKRDNSLHGKSSITTIRKKDKVSYNSSKEKNQECYKSPLQNSVFDATRKIIAFINAKEREYMAEH